MTDLLTYLNVDLLGLKPFHLNLFKTGMIALCLGLGVWVLASEGGLRHMSGLLARLNGLSLPRHRLLAWSLGALFASFLIQLRVRQYYELQTNWDMAVETNVAWHVVHGPWFFNSFDNRLHLGQHFSPVFVLIGLAYAVVEHPLTLLVIQSLALGLGAVAVYELALSRCEEKSFALLAVLLYVFNPYLHHSNAHDFHRSPLAVPTILWLLVFLEERRQGPAGICALLGLTIEESIPLPLAGLGLYLASFRPELRAFGSILAVVSLGYFLLVTKVLLPMFTPEQGLFFWERYANLGASFNEALRNILRNPAWAATEALVRHNQFVYLGYFLIPVAFLPLLAWREASLMVVPLLIMFLSQNVGQHKLFFHYSAPALPFLFFSTIYGLSRVARWLQREPTDGLRRWRILLAGLLFLTGLNSYRCPGYDLGATNPDYAASAFRLAGEIPAGASVATETRFAPLLANRHRICNTMLVPGTLCDWTPVRATSRGSVLDDRPRDTPTWLPDYVLFGAEPSPERKPVLERQWAFTEWLVGEKGYVPVDSGGGVTLFQAASPTHLPP